MQLSSTSSWVLFIKKVPSIKLFKYFALTMKISEKDMFEPCFQAKQVFYWDTLRAARLHVEYLIRIFFMAWLKDDWFIFCKQIIFNFLLIFWILLFNQHYSRCSKKTSIKLLSLRFLLVAAKLNSKMRFSQFKNYHENYRICEQRRLRRAARCAD